MDTLLCNDDGDIVIGTYDPSNTLLRLSAEQYTAGSATWTDQSGNGLDFTVSTNASLRGTDADGFPYMDFSGSYGIAKRIVGGSLTNITAPTTGKYTIFCVTQILNSTSYYRTLIRGSSQHTIIVQTGNNNLGLWNGAFRDSGFDVTTAMTSSRNLLTWELSTTTPYYNFQLNESGTNSTVTSAVDLPFSCIGGYHNNTTVITTSSQYWGNVYEFIVYNGFLSASERDYVAEYLAYKWGISSKLPSLTSTHGVTILESIGALDDLGVSLYNTVGGAYALRRLFGLYPGPQVRLRRSTDNAETDVYFSSDGSTQNLNLTTWLGAATAYVKTWYDQSGNGNHMYSSQEPVLEYDTVQNYYTVNTSGLNTLRPMVSSSYTNLRIGDGAYSAVATFKLNSVDARKILLSMGPANNVCSGQSLHPLSIGNGSKFAGGACGGLGTWGSTSGVTPTVNSYTNMITTFSGGVNGTENVYINNSLDKSATMSTSTPASSDNRISLGWIRNDGASYTANAKIFTLLFYPYTELNSTQRTELNALL